MNTTQTGQVIPFPTLNRWSRVASQYVDYVLRGDPQAACYYLEHQLHLLKLLQLPAVLREAIDREYRRRGIRGDVQFH